MHKHIRTSEIVAWSVLIIVPAVLIGSANHKRNQQLYTRFPDFDRKIVRKTYKKLMNDALAGKIDVIDWSDEKFDQHFRFECYEMQFA